MLLKLQCAFESPGKLVKMQIMISGSGVPSDSAFLASFQVLKDATGPGTTLGITSPRRWMILWAAFSHVQVFCSVFKNLQHQFISQ